MSVELTCRVMEGWKASPNNRFGKCMEIVFIDSNTKKELFIYAPKLKDIDLFKNMFSLLEEFDSVHKEAINVMTKINEFGVEMINLNQQSKC